MEFDDDWPLSLEDQCFLLLISHMEDYSPEALALLPLRLRRKLLLNLPAVDICELEDTAVTEGIDMDTSVWKELVHVQKESGKHPMKHPNFSASSSKQVFFNILHLSLFNFYGIEFTAPTRMLFSSCCCLGADDRWRCFNYLFAPKRSFGYSFPTPARHVTSFTEERLLEQVLRVLVHKCRCWPKHVDFNCRNFLTNVKPWGVVVSKLMGTLLSKTKSLVVNEGLVGEKSYHIPRFVLELVFSECKPTLASLSLRGSPGFLRRAIADASPFFSPAFGTDPESLHRQVLSHAIPYSGLTSLSIVVVPHTIFKHQLPKQLHSMIAYQTSLETLEVCDIDSYSTLSLFHEPQFRSLRLDSVRLRWKDFVVLVPPFLSSCGGGEKPLQLHISHVTFDLSLDGLPQPMDTEDEPLNSEVDTCVDQPRRELIFESIRFEDALSSTHFCSWLLMCHCLHFLSSFTYVDLSCSGSLCAIMALIPEQHHLESFKVSHAKISFRLSSAVPFINLFSAPCLKIVKLPSCQIGTDGLLSALTKGLLCQVPFGQLEFLDLNFNRLGDSDDTDFEEFAGAVFRLPQLAKLTLSIHSNRLTSRHFQYFCEASKKVDHARMRLLLARGNEYEKVNFQEITAKVDTRDYYGF